MTCLVVVLLSLTLQMILIYIRPAVGAIHRFPSKTPFVALRSIEERIQRARIDGSDPDISGTILRSAFI